MIGYTRVQSLMRQLSAGEISRREFLKRTAALGLLAPAALSFATVAEAQEASTPSSDESSDYEEGVYGGTIIVATNTDLASLDIMFGSPDINRDVMGHVYEYLFTMGEGNVTIPDLAEDMLVSEDGRVFTILLRENVLFHDGSEMTSEDVVASLERWQRMTSRGNAVFAELESIVATDDSTVELTFAEPNGGLVFGLGHYGGLAAIYPKSNIDLHTDPEAEDPDIEITDVQYAIGTGPYRVTEWVTDRSVDMVRFEDYTGREEPPNGRGGKRYAYADEIKFVPVPDSTTRLNGLIANEFHIAYRLEPAQYETVDADPNLTAMVIKPGSKPTAVFNKQKGPFTNLQLRQAALAATDPVEVMAGTVDNPEFYATMSSLAGPEWADWYTEVGDDLYWTRDIDRAKQLVEESGYDGSPLRWVTTREFDYMYRSALVSQQQWAEAGLNVELVVTDWPTVLESRSNPDAYEIFSTGIGFAGDPIGTSAYRPDWPGWTTSEGVVSAAMALVTEADPAVRRALWEDLQLAFYEEVPYIQYGELYNFQAARTEVSGFEVNLELRVWNAWLNQ